MTFLTLQGPIQWTFLLHVVFGVLALAFFLIPLFANKGGKLHVRVGWAYTCAMLIVCSSAFIITPWRIFFDLNRTVEKQGFSIFLFFISAFTLSALYFGIISLKFKDRVTPSKAFIHIAPPIVLILLGFGTQFVGIKTSNTLLILFPFLAHLTARSQLQYWWSVPKSKRHWWYAHMSGMCTACIATVTAFLVTALPRIWSNPLVNSPVLWIAPGIVGGLVLRKATKNYQNRFGDLP